MKRAQPLYGHSAREVPEIRDWLVRELADDGKLWLAMTMVGQMVDKVAREEGFSPITTTPDVERRALDEARLFWIPSETCTIIENAALTVPPDLTLNQDSVPYPTGFVVFQDRLTGRPAHVMTGEPLDQELVLRAFRWGPVVLPLPDSNELTEGIALSWWTHTDDYLDEIPSSRMTMNGWLPLGRTDWLYGQRWDEMVMVGDDPERFRLSAVEDRCRALALWALMNTQRPVLSAPARQEVRQALRRGQTDRTALEVNVVQWDPHRHVRDNPEVGSGRKVSVRYHVDPFWRRQPFGPRAEGRRRWTYIPSHWRGPEDAPMVEHKTVTKV